MKYCIDKELLKKKAKEKNTSLDGLAIDLGIDRTTFYRRLRTDKLTVKDVHKIVDVLGFSPDETIAVFLCPVVA